MNTLTGFTDSPRQTTTIVLDSGGSFVLDLYYRSQQMGWFFDLTYNDFILKGQRLVYSPNLLRQFEGQIPFGLAVVSLDQNDPLRQDDFTSGYAAFVLLNEEDVQAIELLKFTRNE
jgi:hypothetical protein